MNKISKAAKLFLIFAACILGCKKDNQDFSDSSLIQHLWTLKSTSYMQTVGTFTFPWQTQQVGTGETWNFSGGTWTDSVPGFKYGGPYKQLSDSILLELNPGSTVLPPGPPDTLFIWALTNNLLVVYYRNINVSSATIEGNMDTLTR